MDEKLLRALSNIGDGLDELVKALQDKKGSKSDTATAIQAGDFSKQLKDIQTGLKSIKKDTQEILKQQKTILETAKKKEADKKTEPFETDPKKESMLKKGVGVIILIAVAVLAIGLAFKIVGKVDFFSVIALGIAIVLIAHAFEKIAATKLDLKQAAIASATMVLIAAGLMFSSFFLKGIKTIGLGQLITAVLIAAAMSLVLPSFAKMMKNLKGLSVFSMLKTIVLLPLILPAIALGIALASYALMLVKPISFGNFLGAIMVGAVFVVLSFGLKKIIKAFEGINPETAAVVAFTAPILFTGMSIAIWLSSKALSKVVPITFQNFVSAVMIAALFVVLAYAVKPIAKAISNMKWSDIPKIPVLFTILSLAIAASAFILFHAQKYIAGIDFMTMLKILVFTIVMGIAVVVLAFVSWLVNKLGGPSFYAKASLSILILATTILLTSKILSKGKYEHVPTFRWLFFSALNIVVYAVIAYVFNKMMTPGEFLKGSISILIMASTIMLTSQILSLGKYEKYPTLKWLIFTAVGILAFGVVAWVLTKLGGISTYLKGALVILVVAGVIMVTSHILNLGRYKSYPTLGWVIGVGAALLAFSLAAGILGLAVFGPQALIFAAGLAAILGVAGTIMATSLILAKGKYDMKGFVGWGLATAMLFAVFVPAIIALGAIGLAGKALSLLGAGDPIDIGKKALLGIAAAIVGVSFILSKGKYQGGPTKAWAEGVGIAIGAFSPVYGMLMANGIMKIFGGGGVGPDDFAKAIKTISRGIVDAATFFAKNKAAFKNPPPKAWAEGVGLAIGAFAPVYTVLMKEKGLFGSGVGVKDMVKAIEAITVGIVTSAMIFNKYKAVFDKGYPTKQWSEGVGLAIGAFSPVFNMLQEKKWWQSGGDVIKNMINGVIGITTAIATSAAIIFMYQKFFKAKIDKDFIKNLSPNILGYAKLSKDLESVLTKEEKRSVTSSGLFSTTTTTMTVKKMSDVSLINRVLNQLAVSSGIIWKNQKIFDAASKTLKKMISDSFIKNLSTNILGYAKLSKDLESVLTKEEKVSVTSSGLFSTTTTTMTVKKMSDVSLINRVLNQLAVSSGIIWKNQKIFEGASKTLKKMISDSFIKNLSTNILGYAKLTRQLEALVTTEEKKTIVKSGFFSDTTTTETTKKVKDLSLVNQVVNQLVITAGILYKNRRFFQNKIDPNFMKGITSNVLQYSILMNQLSKMQGSQGLMDRLDEALGLDPISKAARGMVKIASAYDALAKSIQNFGNALNSISGEKAEILRRLTGNMAILSALDSRMFDSMLRTLERRASMFSSLLSADAEIKGKGGGGGETGVKKGAGANLQVEKTGKYGNMQQQLDQVIDLLKLLNASTSQLDEFLADQGFKDPAKAPPEIS